MIEHRIFSRSGRVGVIVDSAGRTIRDHAPAPVVGASESLRLVLLDGDLQPYDPPGMADAAYLRFSICGDWDPATPPVYVTGAVTRVSVGTYEIDDPSGTYTSEAFALLGREAEKPCVYELAAYAEDPATGSVWSTPLSVVQYVAPLRNRADSLLDPVTLQPADLRGPAGPAATMAVGTVTTLPAGSSATVENVGTTSDAVLNFGIPMGVPGTSIPIPVSVANGGTGATTAAAARANLGAVNKAGDTMSGGLTVPNLTVGSREDGSTVGANSVAGGIDTLASGDCSHAEGTNTEARGESSHAEGLGSIAVGNYTHAEGRGTKTLNDAEHAQGAFNVSHSGQTDAEKTIHSIGVGARLSPRNAVEVMRDGKVFVMGVGGYNGTNPTAATDLATTVNGKQDVITDLATIRSGAAAGATAVQPSGLANYVQKSQTAGLLKNDGTVDTNTYLTQHQDISGKADSASLAAAYDQEKSPGYAIGDYCTYQGVLYRCTTATANPPGAWNAANWTQAAVTDEMGGGGSSYYGIEYLESTGTQYIDTGVTAGVGVRVVAEVEWDSLVQNNTIFGSTKGNASPNTNRYFVCVASDSPSYVSLGANGTYINPKTSAVAVSTGVRYTYDYTLTASAATLLINGETAISESGTFSFNQNYNIFALARNNVGTAQDFSSAKIYSLKIYSGDTLVRDFVPVRSGFVGALLDRVSGTFFLNKGTGDFLLGQDVNPPVPTESPAFTGTPTAPTAPAGTNTTQIATTAFVHSAVNKCVPWANEAKNAVTIGSRSGVVGDYSFAQGISVTATGARSHAEGDSTTATEGNAHAEGYSTSATGISSHAEGRETTAAGAIAHSEGLSTYAAGRPSHSEGSETTAAGIASHADGYRAVTAASGNGSGASTPHDYAFAWQGVSTGGYYRSHGAGTFNINPVGGANGFYIGEDTLTSAIRQNTNYLAYASTTTLAPETAVYRANLANDGTFPAITDTAIPTAAAYYQFELELTVPSTVPATITGPSGWTWLDGHGLPDPADLVGGETICISVRLDCTARTFLASVWRVA